MPLFNRIIRFMNDPNILFRLLLLHFMCAGEMGDEPLWGCPVTYIFKLVVKFKGN